MKINNIKDILNFRINDWSVQFKNHRDYSAIEEGIFVKDYFKLIFLPGETGPIETLNNSNDVFCNSSKIECLISFLKESNYSFLNLVCCGEDSLLSKNIHLLKRIRHRFQNIYFEAKDIECDWVQIIPMGMNMSYILRNGGNDILNYINKKKNKTKLISSAFGSKWPKLNRQIKDRADLQNFTREFPFIDNMFCKPSEYYSKLCDYKFFACPLGNGIQTPKICESIMCETVPVVTDHIAHRELKYIYNLPLLIVKKWTDLNQNFLLNQYTSVYSNIDWDQQKRKFLIENFSNLLNMNLEDSK